MAYGLLPLGALVAAHVLGRGQLSAPPLLHAGLWETWWRERTPPVAAVAVLRLGIMAWAWYLLGLWALVLTARATSIPIGALQTFKRARLPGAATALSLAVAVSPALAQTASGLPTSPHHSSRSWETPVLRYVGPESTRAPRAGHPHEKTVWVVQPGDNLWSIAATTVGEGRAGPMPAERVAEYWLRVIESNRTRLPDPSDASLVYPGDVVILPPVPPEPSDKADWRP